MLGRSGLLAGTLVTASAIVHLSFGGSLPPASVQPESSSVDTGGSTTNAEGASSSLVDSADYLAPLQKLLGIASVAEDQERSAVDAIKRRIAELRAASARRNAKYSADFLIVTVPDPRMAGADFLTDAVLETIRRGVEAPKVVIATAKAHPDNVHEASTTSKSKVARAPILDRYWLPWKPGAPADAVDLHQGLPGLLVFRNLNVDGFVATFVVGEHPALGIDKAAMQRSLRLVDELQDPSDDSVRIVAPIFTGGQESLSGALSHYHAHRELRHTRTYHVVNGSASSLNLNDLMSTAHPARVQYDSTIIPDEILQSNLLDYMDNADHNFALSANPKKESLTLLVESDTGYGQRIGSRLNNLKRYRSVSVIPFPLHISQVLSSYQTQRQEVTRALPKLLTSDPQLAIPLATHEAHARMPAFEPDWSAVRVDLLLREITRSIRDQNVRYVGIIATSSLDKLFLASLVRKNCPNVRLFTTTGDLLLAHPDVSADLSGMMVASTYPLYRSNQDWSGPNWVNHHAAFAHQSELGIYNAIHIALGKEAGMMEYRLPFAAKTESTSRPPIWISVVGRDAIYPIQCRVPDDFQDSNKDKSSPPNTQSEYTEVYAAQLSIANNQEISATPAELKWLLTAFIASAVTTWTAYDIAFRRECRTLLAQTSAVAALALMGVFWIAAAWLLRGIALEPSISGVTKLQTWLTLAALVVALVMLLARVRNKMSSLQRLGGLYFMTTAAVVVALVCCSLWHSSDPESIFAATRAMSLRSGVSPLIPLLFLATAGVNLLYEQVRMSEAFGSQRRRIGTLGRFKSYSFGSLRYCIHHLERRAKQPCIWKTILYGKPTRSVPAILALVLLVFPAMADLSLRSTIDPGWFGVLTATLFGTAVIMTVWQLWLLQQLSDRLRGVLLEIADLPCLGAFSRLPPYFASAAAGGLLFWKRSNYWKLMTIMEQQLCAISSPPITAVNEDVRWIRLRRSFNFIFSKLAARHWPYQTMARAYPSTKACAGAASPAIGAPTPSGWEEAETFVAAMLFSYLVPFLVQIRRLARALLVSSCILVIATWSYPFIPSASLTLSVWALVLLIGYRIWRTAAQLNQDEILSRVAGTDPNKVNWNLDFVHTLFNYLGPILLLVLYGVFGMPSGVIEWFSHFTGR